MSKGGEISNSLSLSSVMLDLMENFKTLLFHILWKKNH